MAPRPTNPPPDRRQEILEAALRVFAEKGYTAATNADIARAAGVTAAALYYYFPSKADLFRAAVTERQSLLLPALHELTEQLMEIPPHIVLPNLIQTAMQFLTHERTQALIRVVLTEGPRNSELAAIWEGQVVGTVSSIFLRYLEHQMDQGAIRRVDPRLVVMMFIGPLLMTLVTRDLMKLSVTQGVDNDQLVQELTRTLLAGLQP